MARWADIEPELKEALSWHDCSDDIIHWLHEAYHPQKYAQIGSQSGAMAAIACISGMSNYNQKKHGDE